MTLNKLAISAAVAALAAGPLLAEPTGDPEAGAEVFDRQCTTCHVIVSPDGETIAGRNARTGPNQYGLAGRQAGTVEGFRYSNSMEEAGESGLEWNEEEFVAYVQDPTGYLREYLDNRRARGSMTYRVRSEEDALNVWAYLYSVAPPEEEGEG